MIAINIHTKDKVSMDITYCLLNTDDTIGTKTIYGFKKGSNCKGWHPLPTCVVVMHLGCCIGCWMRVTCWLFDVDDERCYL